MRRVFVALGLGTKDGPVPPRLLALTLAMLSVTLTSARSVAQVLDLGPSPLTIGEVVAASCSADNPRARRPLNVLHEGASSIVFVYGAANASGLFGAYYKTDLDLAGSGVGNGTIAFDLYVLPVNADNTSTAGHRYSIRDNAFTTIKDVVGAAGVDGAATIVLSTVPSQTTAVGAHSLLSVWGRTYASIPTGGAYSTILPVVAGYLITPTSTAEVNGVVSTTEKRTNINVFNHSYQAASYRGDVWDENASYLGNFTVSAPPLSAVQRALSDFSIGEPGGAVVFSTTDGAGGAFAVVVDNKTNDGDAKLASYRESSPCPNIGGTYTALFANSCGFYGAETVVVQQSGCNVSVPTSFGTVSGSLVYSGGNFTIQWSTCTGSASGLFLVYPTGISAIFTGDARGTNCCANVSGSIFLPRTVTGPGPGTGTCNTDPSFFVSSVTPDSGSPDGGTVVTITGNGFPTNAARLKVEFGTSVGAVVGTPTSTTLQVFTPRVILMPPEGPALFDVTVTDVGSAATRCYRVRNGFIYTSLALDPSIFSVSPRSGSNDQSTKATIFGTNFQWPMQVFMTGGVCGAQRVEASVISVTPTQIQFNTPVAVGGNSCLAGQLVDLVILNPATAKTASCSACFQYYSCPTLTSASPSNLSQDGTLFPGTGLPAAITVAGTHFQAPVTVTLIKDGAPVPNAPVNNANVSSPTSLAFTAPAVSNAALNQQNCIKGSSTTGLKYVPTSFGIRVTSTLTSCSADLPNVLVYNPTDTTCR